MSDDLVKRFEHLGKAADLIKAQAARISELEAALQKKGCVRDQTTTQYCAEAAALQKRVAELEAALKDAAASVKEWGAYASAYLQDKWDLPGEVARYIAIAEGKNDAAKEGGKDE